ncbi:MAG: hypothetical protein KatS3mg051_0111 [Anaerolineae bacterium]|nr:MAG: hypothetical protein KatS3mg051_0111 [Anaerolineae bacterium]
MHLVRRLMAKSAQEWGVSLPTAYLIFLIPLVVSALLIPIRLDKGLYRLLLDEDRLFEWATFACFVLGTLIGLAVVRNRWQARDRLGVALYLLFTLLMFFSAGEEISWGQRVVDFDTPEDLIEINKQDEFNLHNIGESLNLFRALMIVDRVGRLDRLRAQSASADRAPVGQRRRPAGATVLPGQHFSGRPGLPVVPPVDLAQVGLHRHQVRGVNRVLAGFRADRVWLPGLATAAHAARRDTAVSE